MEHTWLVNKVPRSATLNIPLERNYFPPYVEEPPSVNFWYKCARSNRSASTSLALESSEQISIDKYTVTS